MKEELQKGQSNEAVEAEDDDESEDVVGFVMAARQSSSSLLVTGEARGRRLKLSALRINEVA